MCYIVLHFSSYAVNNIKLFICFVSSCLNLKNFSYFIFRFFFIIA